MAEATVIRQKYLALRGVLDERPRRVWAAAEARPTGRGVFSVVLRATGMSLRTLAQEIRELDSGKKCSPVRPYL